MTDAARRRFYFPAWHRAWQRNWTMDRGCAVLREDRAESEWLDQVWDVAGKRSLRQHRSPNQDDVRHACHVVALGRDMSSTTMKVAETNRVVALFHLLLNPLDLDALMRWQNPERAQRDAWLQEIPKIGFAEDYLASLSGKVCGTRAWRTLPMGQLWMFRKLVWKRWMGRGG